MYSPRSATRYWWYGAALYLPFPVFLGLRLLAVDGDITAGRLFHFLPLLGAFAFCSLLAWLLIAVGAVRYRPRQSVVAFRLHWLLLDAVLLLPFLVMLYLCAGAAYLGEGFIAAYAALVTWYLLVIRISINSKLPAESVSP